MVAVIVIMVRKWPFSGAAHSALKAVAVRRASGRIVGVSVSTLS